MYIPPPKMVKKLASTLNAKIHPPDKDMSVGSKIDLVESYIGEKPSLERSKVIITDEITSKCS
jgi:predicted RNase H-like nuclease (RuvC/YqgF family)